MKTNMENYEERFVDYMEGQLDAAEMKEVEAFVALHPELEEDFKLFCSSKLTPDTAIVFTQKDKLMKQKTTVMPLFIRVAAIAASVALLIGIGIHFMKPGQDVVLEKTPLITGLTPIKSTMIDNPQSPSLLKPSTLKAIPIPKDIVEVDEPVMLAQNEVIPTLEPIKSTIVFNETETETELNYREPEIFLAVLESVDDPESSVFSAIDDDLYENTQKVKNSIYKKTAKAFLSAVYTADCYINETVKDLKELASR